MNLVEKITKKQIRTDLPEFRVGDTVRVDIKIDETDASGKKKSRIQAFEGLVMAIQGSGISKLLQLEKFQEMLELKKLYQLIHQELT